MELHTKSSSFLSSFFLESFGGGGLVGSSCLPLPLAVLVGSCEAMDDDALFLYFPLEQETGDLLATCSVLRCCFTGYIRWVGPKPTPYLLFIGPPDQPAQEKINLSSFLYLSIRNPKHVEPNDSENRTKKEVVHAPEHKLYLSSNWDAINHVWEKSQQYPSHGTDLRGKR